MATAISWRSRITGHGEEDPSNLDPNPSNWRTHPAEQKEALTGILDKVGFVQEVILNRTTGHLIDGHLRVALAKEQGEPTVPVVYVELSPEEEAVILATLDPVAALAVRDDAKLTDLLSEVEADGALGKLLENLGSGIQTWVTDVSGPAAQTPSQEKIDKAAEKQAREFTDRATQEAARYVNIPCPHCSTEFAVLRSDLETPY